MRQRASTRNPRLLFDGIFGYAVTIKRHQSHHLNLNYTCSMADEENAPFLLFQREFGNKSLTGEGVSGGWTD